MEYVMGDVHGNRDRFRSVMSRLPLGPGDRLWQLGDMIDRHPYGIELLREIMGREDVTMLLGNHEYMMLNAVTPEGERLPWRRPAVDDAFYSWFRNGGRPTYQAYQKLSEAERRELREFLVSRPLERELVAGGIRYRLVHAAPPELYQGRYGMGGREYPDAVAFAVWYRFESFFYVPDRCVMVFGHTPTSFYQPDPTLSVWNGDGVIGVDCGSGFPKGPTEANPYQGRLACLRLDDRKVWYSEE